MGGVPHLSFESADVPPGEGRARWQALVGAYDVVLPEGQTEADFAVSTEAWLLGDIVVTRGQLSPVELRRSVERISADGRDTFSLGLVKRGHWVGEFDGRPCELRPGQVCVIDFTRPWYVRTAPTDFILLVVPRPPLLALAPQAHELHGRLLDGAAAGILAEHFAALVRHLPQAAASDVPVIRRSTLHMIAESLDTLAPGEASDPASLEARVADRVRRYVEEHLGAPELSPETICRALGISRSKLYRVFPGGGGIAGYIQRRRLEAVHVRLSDPAETRTLAEIARAYGFASHAHFSTAFRRRFGYTPRDARQGAASTMAGGAALQFQSWMVELAARPHEV